MFKSVVNKLKGVNFPMHTVEQARSRWKILKTHYYMTNIRTKEMAVSQQLSNLTKYRSAKSATSHNGLIFIDFTVQRSALLCLATNNCCSTITKKMNNYKLRCSFQQSTDRLQYTLKRGRDDPLLPLNMQTQLRLNFCGLKFSFSPTPLCCQLL